MASRTRSALVLVMLLGCCSPVGRGSAQPEPSRTEAARRISALISDLDGVRVAAPLTPPAAPVPLAEWVVLPEVGLRLRRPEGFEDAEGFVGVQRLALGASLRVARLDVPMVVMHSGLGGGGLADMGLQLRARRDVRVDGLPGLLLRAEQHAYGRPWTRWMLVFGDAWGTHSLTAAFPREHAALVEDALLEALLGAERVDGNERGSHEPPLARSQPGGR